MPVHRYDIESRHGRTDLVDEIANELQGTPSTSGGEAPDIYLKEGSPPDSLIRVYVVWDKWRDVVESQRRGIIIDAIEKAGMKDEAARIAIAMGLTRRDADALGIVEPGTR